MKRICTLFLLCCISLISSAQSVLISPTGEGGMESGNTLAANGWTVVNDGPGNQWVAGIGTFFAGSRGVYIGTPTLWTGAHAHNVCHFYRDISIPAGSTNVLLSFRLKQTTLDEGFDHFSIYTATVNDTVKPHVIPGTGFTQIFNNTNIDLPTFTPIGPIDLTSLAGTTVRLVFTYNTSDAVGPPLSGHPALDNISLTYNCAAPPANTGTTTVCVGQPVSLPLLSNALVGGTWTSSNIAKAIISPTTGLIKGLATGTVTMTYSTGSGCFTTTVVTVTPAVSAITGVTQICPGTTTNLFNATPGGTWTSANTALATVNSATGVVSGLTSGTAMVTYNVNPGCYKTTNITMSTLITPIGGIDLLCQGSTTSLSSTPTGGTWSSSNITVASVNSGNGLVGGINSGVATITYKLSSGCFVTRQVTVNGPAATFTGVTNICPGTSNTISTSSSGGAWASSSPAIATINSTSGTVTGISGGVATISYIISPTCYSTVKQTVNPSPAPIGGPASVCAGAAVVMTSGPGGGSWSSSNTAMATVSATGSVTGLTLGTPTITYTLGTGCIAVRDITVIDAPTAITGGPIVCVGTTVTFNSTPAGGVWSSSNTVKAIINSGTGIATGISPGTANLTYTLTNGCYKKMTATVGANPVAITGKDTVCVGSYVPLNSTTPGGIWTSDNTATATVNAVSGVVYGVAPGSVAISYAANGTGCFVTRQVTVNSTPSPVTGASSVCTGNSIAMTAAPAGGFWTTNNTFATVNTSGLVTGNTPGTTNVSYTLPVGGCYSTVVVTVNETPVISGPSMVVEGGTIFLTAAPGGGSWNSAGSSIATVGLTTGVVSGIAIGNTNISYTSPAGCSASVAVTVIADPAGRPALSGAGNNASSPIFRVYPNPTNGTVTIESGSAGVFSVNSIDGKLIVQYPVSGAVQTIDLLQHVTPGIYVCSFTGKDGSTKTVKLVLER